MTHEHEVAPGVTITQEQMLALLRRRRRTAIDEWQPIKTAPKDGRWILACWRFGTGLAYCASVVRYEDGNGWVECVGELGRNDVSAPTHWMPLPPPPKEQP